MGKNEPDVKSCTQLKENVTRFYRSGQARIYCEWTKIFCVPSIYQPFRACADLTRGRAHEQVIPHEALMHMGLVVI